MLGYLRTPPLQPPLVSPSGVAVSPLGVPVTGAQKGGGPGKGSPSRPPPPPPPAQANFPLPLSEQEVSFPSNFGTLVLLSQGGGGGGGTTFTLLPVGQGPAAVQADRGPGRSFPSFSGPREDQPWPCPPPAHLRFGGVWRLSTVRSALEPDSQAVQPRGGAGKEAHPRGPAPA